MQAGSCPLRWKLKPTLIDQASIRKTFNDANNDAECAGVITGCIHFHRKNVDHRPAGI